MLLSEIGMRVCSYLPFLAFSKKYAQKPISHNIKYQEWAVKVLQVNRVMYSATILQKYF